MPPSYTKLPTLRVLSTLLAATLLTVFAAWSPSTMAEAKGKKRRATSRSRGASGKQISASNRFSKRHGNRGRYASSLGEEDFFVTPTAYPLAPDRIEVIEYGAPPTPELTRQLIPPPPRNPTTIDPDDALLSPSPRRK